MNFNNIVKSVKKTFKTVATNVKNYFARSNRFNTKSDIGNNPSIEASFERDIFSYYSTETESPRNMNYDFQSIEELYKMILNRDSTFKFTLKHLNYKVASLDWSIRYDNLPLTKKRQSKRVLDLIQSEFQKINIENTTYDILTCLPYKKSIIQLMWKFNEDLQIVLDENNPLRLRNPTKFTIDPISMELKYLPINYQPPIDIEYENLRFIYTVNRGNDININGESEIGEAGFWLFHFKRLMIQSWIKTYERFAIPKEILYYDINKLANDNIRNAYSEGVKLMNKINRNVKAVFPEGYRLETLETKLRSNISFEQAVNFFDGAITKLILNSTLTTGTGQFGNYSTAQIHETSEMAKVESIAKLVERFFNNLIKIIVDLNFENVQFYPKFTIAYKRRVFYTEEKMNEILAYDKAIVNHKAPINIAEYLNDLGFNIPADLDTSLTFHGYPSSTGEYVAGLSDFQQKAFENISSAEPIEESETEQLLNNPKQITDKITLLEDYNSQIDELLKSPILSEKEKLETLINNRNKLNKKLKFGGIYA